MFIYIYKLFVGLARMVRIRIHNPYLSIILGRIYCFINNIVIKTYLNKLLRSDYEYCIWRNKLFLDFTPNLKDPSLFREKIIWRTLYDRNPMYTLCADKYMVRWYVEERIGGEYLKILIAVTDNPKKIKLSELPDNFVIKPNHGSGWILFVINKNIKIGEIRKKTRQWLRSNYSYVSNEWHYNNIRPLIMIEEFLFDNDVSPPEYRIYCFDGKVGCIQKTHIDVDVYDGEWGLIYSTCVKNTQDSGLSENIKNKVVEIAEKLSLGFDHVRVDLLIVNNEKIYFNELTFTDGTYRSVWPDFQNYLGEKWRLNRNKYCVQKIRFHDIM